MKFKADQELLLRSARPCHTGKRYFPSLRWEKDRHILTLLPLAEKDRLVALLPLAGEGGAQHRMRAGASAPVVPPSLSLGPSTRPSG